MAEYIKGITNTLEVSLKLFTLVNFLYAVLALALFASLHHVAYAFSTVNEGDMVAGYAAGIAIDLGLLLLAASINQRKKEAKKTRTLWMGVFLFSTISVYANWMAAVVHIQPIEATTGAIGQWFIDIRPFLLSGILPILVIYLSEILSGFHQNKVALESARIKRAATKARKAATPKKKSSKKVPYGDEMLPAELARG